MRVLRTEPVETIHTQETAYLLPSVLVLLGLMLPLVDHFGLWPSPVFYLHPLQPALVLLRAGFADAAPSELAYAFGAGLSWLALAFMWAERTLGRFVVRAAGG